MPSDWMNRYELMQRLNDKSNQLSWKEDVGAISWMILLGMVALFAVLVCIKSCEPVPAAAKPRIDINDLKCGFCHSPSRHEKMTEYFKSKNLPTDPAKLATAVLQTPYPKTLAAIAVAEKSPATSKKGGYKKLHVGVFQMSKANAKAYGKTPADVEGQARQAAMLLRDLLAEEKSLSLAVAKYGGEVNTDKYSRFVMAEIQQVP